MNLNTIKKTLEVSFEIENETDESVLKTFYIDVKGLDYYDVMYVIARRTIDDAIVELNFLLESKHKEGGRISDIKKLVKNINRFNVTDFTDEDFAHTYFTEMLELRYMDVNKIIQSNTLENAIGKLELLADIAYEESK